ncbi:MAG: hypothetical protein JXA78_01350 [Anaerolineales bacterium]|nr:hypothetical protein [Anaerolineales bacterium]
MDFESFSPFAAMLVTLSALALLLADDWRISISALAIQYAGIFALVAVEWPLSMALVKLIAGWMAGAVLGMAALNTAESEEEASASQQDTSASTTAAPPASRLFRLLAVALVSLAVFSQAPALVELLPDFNPALAWGGPILICLGLLKLGFTAQPMPTILGLLTVLGGFEIVYARLEAAPLTAGMLAAINLGLALAGAYLSLAPSMEESE